MNFDIEKHKMILIILFYISFGAAVVYFAFGKLMPFLMPFVLALLFAFLINPIVNTLQDRLRLPRNIASMAVIIIITAILAALAVAAAAKTYEFLENVVYRTLYSGNFEGLKIISEELNKLLGAEIDLAGNFKNLIAPAASGLISVLKPIATGAPGVFVSVVVFILATHFMVTDKDKIIDFFNKITGNKFEGGRAGFRKISKDSVLRYIKAQLIIMAVTMLELTVGFTIMRATGILKAKYFFLIAAGTALLDALPVFGTGFVLIPWAIYKVITGNFALAAALFCMYIVCLVVRQMIEPKIVGESLGIHPLLTLLAMFVGLRAIGIAGMVLFPIAMVFVVQLYKMGTFDNLLGNKK